MRGIFLNQVAAQCSIYESGKMMHECVMHSDVYNLDYMEISKTSDIPTSGYDFYIFNYHNVTMKWLDLSIMQKLRAFVATFVLEVMPNDPFIECPHGVFDAYLAIDPTMTHQDPSVYAFPRPIEPHPNTNRLSQSFIEDSPVIGTFGFATLNKGFDKIVEAVNREFDTATIRMNIPYATYCPQGEMERSIIIEKCRRIAKPGISFVFTQDYMSKDDLILWCSENTVNCFMYERHMAGLCATTDQAISSLRPLVVSENMTFRHLHQYIEPYPRRSLRESIALSGEAVKRMYTDWSRKNFQKKFESVIIDGLKAKYHG